MKRTIIKQIDRAEYIIIKDALRNWKPKGEYILAKRRILATLDKTPLIN